MANENIDIISFAQGGLNSDDDILLLPPGDARFRQNVVISDDFNFNVLTNTKGNTLKNNTGTFSYPAGSIRVIGFVENKEEKAGIFFIYSSTGEHSIVQYYSETDTLEYILRGGSSVTPPIGIGSILNFDLDYFVDAGIIGNEDEKYLVWTDGNNEPRIINIQEAINYTYGLTSVYGSITEDVLRFYKVPLMVPLTIDYQTQVTQQNNVRGQIWQFAVRKKFIDNTYSVLGPHAEIKIPNEEETAYGDFVRININSWIRVRFTDPGDELVDEYQLFFRICDIGSESTGNWYRSNINGVVVGSFIDFYFFNDGDDLAVDQDDANRIYDYVPDLADHMHIIDSNRVVFGGITEGYDNIPEADLDVGLSHEYGMIDGDGYIVALDFSENVANAATSGNINTAPKSTLNEYHYSLKLGTDGVDLSLTYGMTAAEVAEEMANRVSNLTNWTGNYTSPNTFFTVTNNTGTSVYVYMNVVEPHEVYNSFKCGSTQYFGLVYYVNGKPSFIQTTSRSDIFNVDIPYQYEAANTLAETGTHAGADNLANLVVSGSPWTTDQWVGYRVLNITDGSLGIVTSNTANTLYATLSGGTEDDWDFGDVYEIYYYNFNFYNKVNWEITHLPPSGATHYQWAYLGSNIDRYNYYLLSESDDITIDGQYMLISKDIITNFVDAFGGTINYGFDIQPGDRFRLIGIMLSNRDTLLSNSFIDTEIISVDSSSIKINFISELTTSLWIGFYLLIEIYRIKPVGTSNGIYQAVSPMFEIYDDGGTMRHRGDTQDQTSLVPAEGTFNPYFGDTFFQRKVLLNNNNSSNYSPGADNLAHRHTWIENRAVSVMYDSTVTSFGKPNVKNDFAKQDYFNKIRWGGKYLDESGVNFMTKFDFDDVRVLDDRNGRINKIHQIGDTLKVYQERKVNSFYLKTTSSTAADGSQTYVFNSDVLSDVRQSVFDFGCTHFSSYVQTVRSAYYFDIINAVVIKDTPGGPIEVSDQKMHSYFKQKSKDILEYSGTVLVLGGYDEDLSMYLITFFDPDSPSDPINETLGYYEPLERWVSFYSYLPEYYGKISGDTALAFCDGQMYLQNSNSTRNNFCGSQYTSIVDVHSNGNPQEVKAYSSISNISTGSWAPDQDGDVLITLPIEMQSRLLHGKFKVQEGVYNSEFLRDALVTDGTGTTTFERSQLHNGRALRGLEMRARLRNTDTNEANLRLVTVKSSFSR